MHVRLLAIPFLAVASSASCQNVDAEDVKPPRPAPILLSDNAALLPAIQVESLTLTPIVATDAGMPKQDVDVLVLDEAFAKRLVQIKEQPSESVNNLTLTNKADRPLFLLAGEVVIGGKQDRIIGQNTIIAANTTQSVPVFCVEHGRWDVTTNEFTSGKALAHGRLRGKASFENQQEVWREVNAKNIERKTTNSTDTYRQVAEQQQNGTLGKSFGRVTTALGKLAAIDRSRMIGYVVSLNGKVATVDMFGSPALFKKLEDKLVRSYLTESIDVVAAKDIKAPTVADVKSFMADADKAKEEPSYESDVSATVRYKGMKAAKARVEFKTSKASPKSAEPYAKKPAVYETYQAK